VSGLGHSILPAYNLKFESLVRRSLETWLPLQTNPELAVDASGAPLSA
jgi:hypothetical protein